MAVGPTQSRTQWMVLVTVLSLTVKGLEHDANHLPLSTAEFKNAWSHTFCLPYYRGADKSLARPTSRCILFDGENIWFDASLVIYINSTNIPPIVIINRIYEYRNLLSLLACFLLGRAKDLSAPLSSYRAQWLFHFCLYQEIPAGTLVLWVFPGGKVRPGRDADPSPLLVPRLKIE